MRTLNGGACALSSQVYRSIEEKDGEYLAVSLLVVYGGVPIAIKS